MESSLFLRIEILILCITFIYIIYYIGYIALKSSRSFRRMLGIGTNKKIKEKKFSVTVEKSDDSSVKAHSKNKRKLTNTDKLKLQELLKKVQIHVSKREFDIAKNMIIEGLTIDKFHTDLNIELANIYIEEEEYVKAEYIYKDLMLVHSENTSILKRLGYILSLQEKYELAIEVYKKAYRDLKGDEEILNMLGQLTYHIEDYLGAVKYSKKLLKIHPKSVDNMRILASAYEKTQSNPAALEVYKELSQIVPYDTKINSKIKELSM